MPPRSGFNVNVHFLNPALIEHFSNVCSITADLSALEAELQPKPSLNGFPPHYELNFEVVILFGLTELKAFCAWKENVSWGLASLVPFCWSSCGLFGLLSEGGHETVGIICIVLYVFVRG